MGAIEHIHSRQILDSRGNPTLEVDVFTSNRPLVDPWKIGFTAMSFAFLSQMR